MLTEVVEGFRLSLQQEHLCLLQKSDLSQTYRAQCAVLIKENLDVNTLTAALQDVVNRHEILRTTFRCLPGMTIPVQVITSKQVLLEQKYNLSDCTSLEQENKIEAIFDEIGHSPFDFEQGSLLHASLVTLSPDRYILLVSMPAMLADSATLNNLVGELSRSYSAYLQGQELSEQPLQYADFAEWQNELQETDETEIGRQYWQKQDLSAIFHLKLPEDRNQPNQAEFNPQFITSKIIFHQVAEIEAVTQKYDSAVSIFLLACWQVLIWRLTQQSDIIVGTACTGRNYQEIKEALGLFARYLPLHCHLEDNLSFRQILQNIDESVLNISRWQDCFNWQENLEAADKYNELLFCPFCFDFQEEATKYCEGDVSFSIYKQFTCIDRFKIKLSGHLQDNSLIVDFHYDPYQFGAEDIERLLDQFHQLVKSAIKNPEAAISELEILSDRAKHQLLVQFNETQADYPPDKCIHHLFEEQAELTPNNIAVAFENLQLTYTELNTRANQLAYYLQKQGVKSEVLVGICVERSLEMIVGILGILKAGGAYIPIDPVYPQERLALMLEDAQTLVLLTQQHLLEGLPAHNAQTICLDTAWETITQESKENLTLRTCAENLAYVIYTSGSTGKPKGVQIAHRNLVHSTTARIAYYQERVTSFLLLSSFAFDSSVAGIFWTLCAGGILYLPQEGLQREIPKLIELIDQNHISHLLTLPSLYALLLEQAKPEQLISLRTLIVAGEACPTELVQRHLEVLSETSLFNEYGPTEGTVWSSVYHCYSSKLRTQVPIGRPIANTQIYLLDSHLHPVPLGVAGELYISGNSIARGYLNCPDVTAEKFRPNPFSKQAGSYLYKTGDLARYLLDGNIEFLGRIDHQVKIRGYRIELGEVEAVLSQHPEVRSLAVIAREDESAQKRLVAYVVPQQGESPRSSDLRRFLQDKLPEYMVPSAFIRIKTLPHLPNGKVDIRALPAPETVRSELSETFVAPRTTVEEMLAEIWTQVLRLKQVGIHDNFFELGGDSIISIQIAARANQAGLQLTPKQLFAHQTIAELAAVAGTLQNIQTEQELVTGQVPLTPIQHWFKAQNLPNPHDWNQAILLEVRQTIDFTLLEQVVQQLLVHHDALRLRFSQQKSGWQQVSGSLDEIIPVIRQDFSALPEVEQELAIDAAVVELQASLNLSDGPLVRVALFDLGGQKPNRLLIVIHYLAVDSVSWRILIKDFQTAYGQLGGGEAIHLPPKTTSFKQWAIRLSEYAQSAALKQDLNYWLAEPRLQVLQLPVDFPESDNTVVKTGTVSVALSVAETQTLLQEVPKAYQTQINDILLTALVLAFKRWTGTSKLLVDLEGQEREKIFDNVDLSCTVGSFASIFPVLLDLGEASDIQEALKAVKEQLRCIPNQGIGYGVLRYLSSEREIVEKLQAMPQAEVKFHFQDCFDQVVSESSMFTAIRGFSHGESYSHLLDISWFITGNQLQLDWKYSEGVYRQVTIESLVESFIEALRSLITHCQSNEVRSFTPSDFPKANLSQKDLDQFLAKINLGIEKTNK